MASRVLELLRSMDLFDDLSDDELNKIARLLKEQKLAENDQIFAQDDPGDALYIVLQGRVRIATTDQLRAAIEAKRPGDTISPTYRRGGTTPTVRNTLASRPS